MKTFAEMRADKPGTVYVDKEVNNLRCLIVRGHSALCAYIGVPTGHPFHGLHYSDIHGAPVHGGLTHSIADGRWWLLGWDYAHANLGDIVFDGKTFRKGKVQPRFWTIEDIEKDVITVLPWFKERGSANEL